MNAVRIAVSRRDNEKGQGLMEFAVSFLIFIILLAGIVDIGRLFFTYMALKDGAQEGAAYGSVQPMRYNEIHNRVKGVSKFPLDFSDESVVGLVVEVDYEDGPCAGEEIVVTVTTQYSIMMPLIGAMIGTQTVPLTAAATDHILRPPCKE